jgi:anti-sigma regulatory factor (Ser/Thr protein kinase)
MPSVLLRSTTPSLTLDIDHSSAATEARRVVASICQMAGLSETACGAAAIIVNELTTNLLKHAKDGVLFAHGSGNSVDIVAVDRGPGVRDLASCLRDGFSSAGTAGTGLGAVRRLASQFDMHSVPGKGTVVFARIRAAADAGVSPVETGAFWRAMQPDDLCGDACTVLTDGEVIVAVVADGLGHGVAAADASRAAVASVTNSFSSDPVRMLEILHAALRPTRGAAVAVAVIQKARRLVRFAGIGNIAATIRGAEGTKSLVSLNGIAGHQVRTMQEFQYDWPRAATLIMHSDGLTSRWNLEQEPGLAQKAPAIIAAVLARDFARERDDRCALVVREGAA